MVDDNPLFCVVSHVMSLALADQVFAKPDLNTPEKLFNLAVERPGTQYLPIPWGADALDRPLFRPSIQTEDGIQIASDSALPYHKYHPWVKQLGMKTGFLQVMTTYCLRRAEGNAINGECAVAPTRLALRPKYRLI